MEKSSHSGELASGAEARMHVQQLNGTIEIVPFPIALKREFSPCGQLFAMHRKRLFSVSSAFYVVLSVNLSFLDFAKSMIVITTSTGRQPWVFQGNLSEAP
jgi:hypothetical protein